MIKVRDINDILHQRKIDALESPILRSDGNYINTYIYQPGNKLTSSTRYLKYTDEEIVNSKLKYFFRLIQSKESLSIIPEYCCTLDFIYHVLQEIEKNESKLLNSIWIFGCITISQLKLRKLINDFSNIEWIFNDDLITLDQDGFFNPIFIITESKRRNSSKIIVVTIQIKTTPLAGDWERFSMISGNDLYFLTNKTYSIKIVPLICSDALNTNLVSNIKEQIPNFHTSGILFTHLQLNPDPFNEAFALYRKEIFKFKSTSIEILCCNWAKETTLNDKPFSQNGFGGSSFHTKSNELDLSTTNLNNNAQHGLEFSKQKYLSNFFFRFEESVFNVKLTKPSLGGAPGLRKRSGPKMNYTYSWESLKWIIDDQSLMNEGWKKLELFGFKKYQKDIFQKSSLNLIGNLDSGPSTIGIIGYKKQKTKFYNLLKNDGIKAIIIKGQGGIGKSSFVSKYLGESTIKYKYYWLNLKNRPELLTLLKELLNVLSSGKIDTNNIKLNVAIEEFFKVANRRKCIFILDNYESILAKYSYKGNYDKNYLDYKNFMSTCFLRLKNSKLIITSRELPEGMESILYTNGPLDIVELDGLNKTYAKTLLKNSNFKPSDPENIPTLITFFKGHPHCLKISIVDIKGAPFHNNISLYLSNRHSFLGSNSKIFLDSIFENISKIEFIIIYWMAVERVELNSNYLFDKIDTIESESELYSAINKLNDRKLIEVNNSNQTIFLQNVLLEYVTDRLISQVYNEIFVIKKIEYVDKVCLNNHSPNLLISHNQIEFIIDPILDRIYRSEFSAETIENTIKEHLLMLQNKQNNYAVGNLITLLNFHLKMNLSDQDFSNQIIKSVNFSNTLLHNSNFSNSELINCEFRGTLNNILSIISLNNNRDILVAGLDGVIFKINILYNHIYSKRKIHDDFVWSLDYNQSLRQIVSCSADGKVKLIDQDTLQIINSYNHSADEKQSRVLCCRFSKDDLYIISGGEDKCLRITPIDKRKEHWFEELDSNVNCIENNSRNNSVLIGCESGTLYQYKTEERELTKLAKIENNSINSICNKENYVLIGGTDGNLYSLTKKNKILLDYKFNQQITHIDISEKRFHGAISTASGAVHFMDLKKSEKVKSIEVNTDLIHMSKYIEGLDLFISAGNKQLLRKYNSNSYQPISNMKGYYNPIWSLKSSNKSNRIYSSGENGQLYIWKYSNDGKLDFVSTTKIHNSRIWSFIANDDSTFFFNSEDDKIIKLSLPSGDLISNENRSKYLRNFCLTENLDYVVSCDNNYNIVLFDPKYLQPKGPKKIHNHFIRSITSWKDYTISVCDGGFVGIWNFETDNLEIIKVSEDGLWSTDISKSGQIACGGRDSFIAVFSIQKLKKRLLLKEHTGWVRFVQFSNNEKYLATLGEDLNLVIWNTNDWSIYHKFENIHTDRAISLCWSRDDDIVFTASQGAVIKSWSVIQKKYLKSSRVKRPYEKLKISDTKIISKFKTMSKNNLIQLGAYE